MFNNEDVTVGSWMLAMNVEHEDNRAICDPRCTPTSIAVWDIPKCSGSCFRVACLSACTILTIYIATRERVENIFFPKYLENYLFM